MTHKETAETIEKITSDVRKHVGVRIDFGSIPKSKQRKAINYVFEICRKEGYSKNIRKFVFTILQIEY